MMDTELESHIRLPGCHEPEGEERCAVCHEAFIAKCQKADWPAPPDPSFKPPSLDDYVSVILLQTWQFIGGSMSKLQPR